MSIAFIVLFVALLSQGFATTTTVAPTTAAPATTSGASTAAPTTTVPTTTTPTPPNGQIVLGNYTNVSLSLAEGEFVLYRMNVTADQFCEDEELVIDVTSTGNFAKRLHVSSTGLTHECSVVTNTVHYSLTWLDDEIFSLDTDLGTGCADGTTTCDTATEPVELGSLSDTYEICTMFWCEAASGCTLTGSMEVVIESVDISLGGFSICGVSSLEVVVSMAIALLAFLS